MADFKLIHGIYESVITHALEERLSRISDSFDVEKIQLDSEESSFALTLHLTKLPHDRAHGDRVEEIK